MAKVNNRGAVFSETKFFLRLFIDYLRRSIKINNDKYWNIKKFYKLVANFKIGLVDLRGIKNNIYKNNGKFTILF